MEKVDIYRQVYAGFKELCARGEQTGTFASYCRERGVESAEVRSALKGEYRKATSLPGYRSVGSQCLRVYEEFRDMCARGEQPCSLAAYSRAHGLTSDQMHYYMKDHGLRIVGLPGFRKLRGPNRRDSGRRTRWEEVPFEQVLFEESGFLPAACGGVITVRVDGGVEVSFPADTEVDVVARFVRRVGKGVRRVES